MFQLCNTLSENDFLEEYFENEYRNKYYLGNIKFDGERIIASCKNGVITLINRNKRCCNNNFLEVVEELKKLKGNFVLDGEIITKDDKFSNLQKRALTKSKEKQKELMKSNPVVFMVFDILEYNPIQEEQEEKEQEQDEEKRELPQTSNNLLNEYMDKRIIYLKKLFEGDLKDSEIVLEVEYLPIKECYKKAREEDREGIIVKYIHGRYNFNRNANWSKVKFFKEAEIQAIKYEDNPTGIRVEDKDGISCQVARKEDIETIKNEISTIGYSRIVIQYLEKTENGKYRFPSYRRLVTIEQEQEQEQELNSGEQY